jgi:hypothetical protein
MRRFKESENIALDNFWEFFKQYIKNNDIKKSDELREEITQLLQQI